MKALQRVIFNMISFQINIGVLGVNIWKVWIVKSINQSFRKSWMSVIFNQHLKEFSNQVKHFWESYCRQEKLFLGVKVNFPNNDECQVTRHQHDRCCQSNPKYSIIIK